MESVISEAIKESKMFKMLDIEDSRFIEIDIMEDYHNAIKLFG